MSMVKLFGRLQPKAIHRKPTMLNSIRCYITRLPCDLRWQLTGGPYEGLYLRYMDRVFSRWSSDLRPPLDKYVCRPLFLCDEREEQVVKWNNPAPLSALALRALERKWDVGTRGRVLPYQDVKSLILTGRPASF